MRHSAVSTVVFVSSPELFSLESTIDCVTVVNRKDAASNTGVKTHINTSWQQTNHAKCQRGLIYRCAYVT